MFDMSHPASENFGKVANATYSVLTAATINGNKRPEAYCRVWAMAIHIDEVATDI